MRRLGWAVLLLVLLGIGGLVSFTRFGPAVTPPRAAPKPVPERGGWLVPVRGVARSALGNSWGDERGGGGRLHEGLDVMAPGGTPVVAAAGGVVEKLHRSEQGGTTLYVRTDDRRWVHYYAHLSAYAAGMREGLRVRAGQVIGFVGDTGNAGPGNTHLHFGVQRMQGGERWWQGQAVNPYPLLARGERPR